MGPLAWTLFVGFAYWWAIAGVGALGLLLPRAIQYFVRSRRKAAKEIKLLEKMYNFDDQGETEKPLL